MPDELTPEEQDILANSPADAPVIVGDDDTDEGEAPPEGDERSGMAMSDPTEDQPADEDVMGTAGGPTTVPDATEADPEAEEPS
jgi:hypothetical protein